MQTGIATNPPILYAPPGLTTTPGQTNVNFVPVLNSQPSTNKIDRFPKRAGRLLGSIQLTCGILCIIFQSAAIALESELAYVGHGIWCGIVFVLAGSFGIAAAKYKTKCMIVTFMVLSVVSAAMTPIVLVISAIGWEDDADECSRGYWDYDKNEWICQRADDVVIAMNAMLVFTAVVEGVTAILSAITCCRAYCCCRDKTSNSKQQFIVVYTGNGADGNPTVISTQTLRLQQPIAQGMTPVNPEQNANQAGAPPKYEPPSTDECFKQRM